MAAGARSERSTHRNRACSLRPACMHANGYRRPWPHSCWRNWWNMIILRVKNHTNNALQNQNRMRTSEKCHDTLAASDALKECSRWVKALYRRRWFEFGHSILIPQTLEYWTKKIWFSNRRRRRHRSIRGLVYPARIESRRIRIQSKLRSNVAQNALEIQRRWRFNNLNGVSIQYSPHIRMCCTAALLQLMSNFGNELNFLFLCTFFFRLFSVAVALFTTI